MWRHMPAHLFFAKGELPGAQSSGTVCVLQLMLHFRVAGLFFFAWQHVEAFLFTHRVRLTFCCHLSMPVLPCMCGATERLAGTAQRNMVHR